MKRYKLQYYSCTTISKYTFSAGARRKKSRYHLVVFTRMGIWNQGGFQYWRNFSIAST